MEELIRNIIVALVDFPDEVNVKKITGTNGSSIYEVKVAKADTGKVIGKQGRNASALRTIVDAASKKNHIRSIIEILE